MEATRQQHDATQPFQTLFLTLQTHSNSSWSFYVKEYDSVRSGRSCVWISCMTPGALFSCCSNFTDKPPKYEDEYLIDMPHSSLIWRSLQSEHGISELCHQNCLRGIVKIGLGVLKMIGLGHVFHADHSNQAIRYWEIGLQRLFLRQIGWVFCLLMYLIISS